MGDLAQEIRLDRDRGVPLGTQLAWRLRSLIASERLARGARLPSVRELAHMVDVNVNTVRAVYGRLEQEGYLNSEQGRGTFVARRATAGEQAGEVERLAVELDAEARQAGVDPHEVAAYLYGGRDHARRHEPPAGAGPSGGAGEAGDEVRRRLRQQIAELEAELAWHPPPAGGESRSLAGPRSGGAVLGAEQLEQIRDELQERLHRADARRAELIAELRRLRAEEERAGSQRQAASGERDQAAPRSAGATPSPSLVGARVRWVGGF